MIIQLRHEAELFDQLTGIHHHIVCMDTPCVIHNASDHHMRTWPIGWRGDTQIFERLCPHGVGHPDPDQFEYWDRTNQSHKWIHGCDHCCAEPPEESSAEER